MTTSPSEVRYRLRTHGFSPFSQVDIYGGEWAGEPHDDLLSAAREFVKRKGVGTLRIMRDVDGSPRALLHRELREVSEYVAQSAEREEVQARKRRAGV